MYCAPLAQAYPDEDQAGVQKLVARAGQARLIGKTMEPIYGFRSLLGFKAKFRAVYEPMYLCYPETAALARTGLEHLPRLRPKRDRMANRANGRRDAVLNTLALLFGVGVGLAFDEFALLAASGRRVLEPTGSQVDRCGGMDPGDHRLGAGVLDLSTVFQGVAEAGSMWWLTVLLFLLTVVPAGICAAKGKLVTAALGIVYQPIGMIGAVRVGKPGS